MIKKLLSAVKKLAKERVDGADGTAKLTIHSNGRSEIDIGENYGEMYNTIDQLEERITPLLKTSRSRKSKRELLSEALENCRDLVTKDSRCGLEPRIKEQLRLYVETWIIPNLERVLEKL